MYLNIKQLPNTAYQSVYADMLSSLEWEKVHTLIITEHLPVYTLGYRFKEPRFKQHTDIPVIHTDRGGNITYHGPGQIVFYPLCHLPSLNASPVEWVHQLESVMIQALNKLGLACHADKNKPGLYINQSKIASIGVRVRKNRSYHGIALNHKMDLSPFDNIAPCGYDGLEMTSVSQFLDVSRDQIIASFIQEFCRTFGLNTHYDCETT